MYCKKCGTEIADNAQFCPACGTSQTEAEPQRTPKSERWETTTRTVSPSKEKKVTAKLERFGWELMSSQTVDNKDSHLEERWDGIYSVTESTNYVKLIFRRNKNMPRYEELAALEEELEKLKAARNSNHDLEPDNNTYDECWTNNDDPRWAVDQKIYFGFGVYVCGAMALVVAFGGPIVVSIIGVVLLAFLIRLFVKHRKKVKKYQKEEEKWNASYKALEAKAKSEYSRKNAEIYKKAEEILSGK